MSEPTLPTGQPPAPPSGRGSDRSGVDRLLIASAIVAVALLLGGIGYLVAGRLGVLGGSSPSPTQVAGASPAPSPVAVTPGPATGAPTPPLTPGPAPTPTGATPAPSASQGPTAVPEDLAQEVAAVEAQVPPIQGLDPTSDVPTRVLSNSAARDDLTTSFDRENPPAELKAQQDLLERLGSWRRG